MYDDNCYKRPLAGAVVLWLWVCRVFRMSATRKTLRHSLRRLIKDACLLSCPTSSTHCQRVISWRPCELLWIRLAHPHKVEPVDGAIMPHTKLDDCGDEFELSLRKSSSVETAALLWLQRAADREQDSYCLANDGTSDANKKHMRRFTARGRRIAIKDAVDVWETELSPVVRHLTQCSDVALSCDVLVRERPADSVEGHPVYSGDVCIRNLWSCAPIFNGTLPAQRTLSGLFRSLATVVEQFVNAEAKNDSLCAQKEADFIDSLPFEGFDTRTIQWKFNAARNLFEPRLDAACVQPALYSHMDDLSLLLWRIESTECAVGGLHHDMLCLDDETGSSRPHSPTPPLLLCPSCPSPDDGGLATNTSISVSLSSSPLAVYDKLRLCLLAYCAVSQWEAVRLIGYSSTTPRLDDAGAIPGDLVAFLLGGQTPSLPSPAQEAPTQSHVSASPPSSSSVTASTAEAAAPVRRPTPAVRPTYNISVRCADLPRVIKDAKKGVPVDEDWMGKLDLLQLALGPSRVTFSDDRRITHTQEVENFPLEGVNWSCRGRACLLTFADAPSVTILAFGATVDLCLLRRAAEEAFLALPCAGPMPLAHQHWLLGVIGDAGEWSFSQEPTTQFVTSELRVRLPPGLGSICSIGCCVADRALATSVTQCITKFMLHNIGCGFRTVEPPPPTSLVGAKLWSDPGQVKVELHEDNPPIEIDTVETVTIEKRDDRAPSQRLVRSKTDEILSSVLTAQSASSSLLFALCAISRVDQELALLEAGRRPHNGGEGGENALGGLETREIVLEEEPTRRHDGPTGAAVAGEKLRSMILAARDAALMRDSKSTNKLLRQWPRCHIDSNMWQCAADMVANSVFRHFLGVNLGFSVLPSKRKNVWVTSASVHGVVTVIGDSTSTIRHEIARAEGESYRGSIRSVARKALGVVFPELLKELEASGRLDADASWLIDGRAESSETVIAAQKTSAPLAVPPQTTDENDDFFIPVPPTELTRCDEALVTALRVVYRGEEAPPGGGEFGFDEDTPPTPVETTPMTDLDATDRFWGSAEGVWIPA